MKKILLVGSVALDDIETADAKVVDVLGGSAVYFSYAASFWAKINLVGVVGSDYPFEKIEELKSRGVDFSGLEVQEGKSFHWSGRYHQNMDERDTVFTHLNVFETFNPKIPEQFKNSEIVFLANIHPSLQLQVLDHVSRPELVILDTMNLWINNNPAEVRKIISHCNVLIINDSEAALLTGKTNFIAAAQDILEQHNLQALVIKLGKFGVYLTSGKEHFFLPAYPVVNVVDPTGAGDSFAGGFVGYLAGGTDYSFSAMKKALIYGSVIASYTVSDFSIHELRTVRMEDVQKRYEDFLKILQV